MQVLSRLLFARVEAWVVLLVFLLCLIGMIAFGFLVRDATEREPRYGALSKAAFDIAAVPDTIKMLMDPPDRVRVWNSARFDNKPTGWSKALEDRPVMPGYLLLSRYDGSDRRHRVELISLQDWQIKHSWSPDGADLLEGAQSASRFIDFSTWNTSLFRAIHPLLLPDGDLIVKDHYSPLFRIDACGRRTWLNDDKVFHHSTMIDSDRNLWIPSLVEPQEIEGVLPEFAEDEILKLDLDGGILFQRSVPDLMVKHGLDYLLFTNGSYGFDPTHLNDIEPVNEDGPYWKKGDVFLSLRNISTIMLYRPATDQIVWWKQGPWVAQHDVDVIDATRISVFDNHAEDRGKGAMVRDHSDVIVYDFATDTIERPVEAAMRGQMVQTLFAGLYDVMPGGYALIEDVTNARHLIIGPDGELAVEFVNRADNGHVYHLGWSRYIDQATGDAAVAANKGVTCDE